MDPLLPIWFTNTICGGLLVLTVTVLYKVAKSEIQQMFKANDE